MSSKKEWCVTHDTQLCVLTPKSACFFGEKTTPKKPAGQQVYIASYKKVCQSCLSEGGICSICGNRHHNTSSLHTHMLIVHFDTERGRMCHPDRKVLEDVIAGLDEEREALGSSDHLEDCLNHVMNDLAALEGNTRVKYIGPPYL